MPFLSINRCIHILVLRTGCRVKILLMTIDRLPAIDHIALPVIVNFFLLIWQPNIRVLSLSTRSRIKILPLAIDLLLAIYHVTIVAIVYFLLLIRKPFISVLHRFTVLPILPLAINFFLTSVVTIRICCRFTWLCCWSTII